MQQKDKREKGWVGSWAAAQQLVEEHNMPPEPGLANNTLRQVIRVSHRRGENPPEVFQ